MAKRMVIAIILLSMVLHSASRLGLLSYLYEQRHEIAYVIGLVNEKPIAICSSNHQHDKNLSIEAQDDADQSLPPAAFQANEIQLFFACVGDLNIGPKGVLSDATRNTPIVEVAYTTPALSIFHPPS